MKSFYDIFFDMYVQKAMLKHKDNPAWNTVKKTIDNLGGEDGIWETYSLWTMVSSESQTRILGFNSDDVQFNLRVINSALVGDVSKKLEARERRMKERMTARES